MKKQYKTMEGILIRPLAVGARAIFLHAGRLVRTSCVTAIHSMEDGVCFETADAAYRLLTGPTKEPAVCQFPTAMAA